MVDEAAAQLLRLAAARSLPGLAAPDALRLLLDAADAAPPRAAPAIARAAVAAFLLRERERGGGGGVGAGGGAGGAEAWARHPLCAALLAAPAGAQQLLAGACGALTAHPARGEGLAPEAAWAALRPFFSYVLLRPLGAQPGSGAAAGPGGGGGGAGDRLDAPCALALRAALAGGLARAACGDVRVARLAAPFLLRHLACMPLADEAVRCVRA